MELPHALLIPRKRSNLLPYYDETKLSQSNPRGLDLDGGALPTQTVSVQERDEVVGWISNGSLSSAEASEPEKESKDASDTIKVAGSLKTGLNPISKPQKAKKRHVDIRRPQKQVQAELGLSKEDFKRLTNKIIDKLESKNLLGKIDFRHSNDLGARSDQAWLKIELRAIRDECLLEMDDELSLSRIDKCILERTVYINSRENRARYKGRKVRLQQKPEKQNAAEKADDSPSPHSQMLALTNRDRYLQLELNDNAGRQARGHERGEGGQANMIDLQNRAAQIAPLRRELRKQMGDTMEMISLEEQEEWLEKENRYKNKDTGEEDNSEEFIYVSGFEFV